MAIRSRSVALLRHHLARPRAGPSLSLTTEAAAAAPPYTVASLHRELKNVKAKVDEVGKDLDVFRSCIAPFMMAMSLAGEWFRDSSIRELKESVAMLKEEKEKEKEKAASSSAMPAASGV